MSRLTLRDAADICVTPFLDVERRREAARLSGGSYGQPPHTGGVAWSGLGKGASAPLARTEGEIEADARTAMGRAQAFLSSHHGRLLTSLNALIRAGHADAAERIRAAYLRGFSDPRAPATPSELECALRIAAELPHAQSRQVVEALQAFRASAYRWAAE